MVITAQFKAISYLDGVPTTVREYSSMRAAEAAAIDYILNNVDDDPNVKMDIQDETGKVVKTYTYADVQPLIQQYESSIQKPKDETFWQARVPRKPSGRPAVEPPEDRNKKHYNPGDIVEIYGGPTTPRPWHIEKEDRPVEEKKASVITWEKAAKYLQGGKDKTRRKLDSNTWIELIDENAIAIVLHKTRIVTFHKDGTYDVYMGGWNTKATRERINNYTNANLHAPDQERNGNAYGFIIKGYEFGNHDIVTLDKDGNPIAKDGSPLQKLPEKEEWRSRAGEIAEIVYIDDARTKRHKEYWYAVIYMSDGDKGFYPQHQLVPVKTYEQPSSSGTEETPVIAQKKKKPFDILQKSFNDKYKFKTGDEVFAISDVPTEGIFYGDHLIIYELHTRYIKSGKFYLVLTDDNQLRRISEQDISLVQPTDEGNEEEDSDIRQMYGAKNPFAVTAQELKNDTFSQQNESSSSVQKDEGRTLEVIDRTQDVKNKVPGPWDGTERKAQNKYYKFKVGDDAWYLEDGMHCIIERLMDTPDRYYVECDSGHIDYVMGNELSSSPPKYGEDIVVASNPFAVCAQTDHETAETGHIGDGDDTLQPGDGKRTPGNINEPPYPFAHELDQNSTHKQL